MIGGDAGGHVQADGAVCTATTRSDTMSKIGDRFKTGQICDTSGIYTFDGYTDSSQGPQPTQDERLIPLRATQVFPPIRSTNRGAYWKLQRVT
jgi:hypothetical protein